MACDRCGVLHSNRHVTTLHIVWDRFRQRPDDSRELCPQCGQELRNWLAQVPQRAGPQFAMLPAAPKDGPGSSPPSARDPGPDDGSSAEYPGFGPAGG